MPEGLPARFTEPLGTLIVPDDMELDEFLELLSTDPTRARQLSAEARKKRDAN